MRSVFSAVILCALLAFLTACQTDSQMTMQQGKGSLSCFSIAPPKTEIGMKLEALPTCDVLCAEKNALCTGMQNGGSNPPVTCSDHVSSQLGVCRCCGVTP